MKTQTINNLDYFERDDGYIELITSNSCCDPDSILIHKQDWYQLIEWLLESDDVIKKMVEGKSLALRNSDMTTAEMEEFRSELMKSKGEK